MPNSATRKQRRGQTSEANEYPNKKAKTTGDNDGASSSKNVQITGRKSNAKNDNSDDDDEIPLTQRRAFLKRKQHKSSTKSTRHSDHGKGTALTKAPDNSSLGQGTGSASTGAVQKSEEETSTESASDTHDDKVLSPEKLHTDEMRERPGCPSETNEHPNKARRTRTNVTASSLDTVPITNRTSNAKDDNSVDDDDEKPLIKRRTLVKRKQHSSSVTSSSNSDYGKEAAKAKTRNSTSDQGTGTSSVPSATNDTARKSEETTSKETNSDRATSTETDPKEGTSTETSPEEKTSMESSSENSHMDVVEHSRTVEESSLEKQAETISSKFRIFLDQLLAAIDEHPLPSHEESLLSTDSSGALYLRLSAMRKFTVLTLRAAHYKVLKDMDMEKMSKVVQIMERSCIRAAELDVISGYIKQEKQEAIVDSNTEVISHLENIFHALEAAAMILQIVATKQIDKPFLPPDLLMTCLQLLRAHLENTIYPLIDLNIFEEDATSLNNDHRRFLAFVERTATAKNYMCHFLPLLTQILRNAIPLLRNGELEEHAIVTLSYIAMGPFFHDYSEDNRSFLVKASNGETTVNPYEQLRHAALDVLRQLFGQYPQHRKWILAEILTSLNSLTAMDTNAKRYRLRNGTKIHVVSALFMQLIQSCAVVGDFDDHRVWLRKWDIRYQKIQKEGTPEQLRELDDKFVQKTLETWNAGLTASTQCATYLLDFLLSKCKSRTKDAYSVSEYRMILESTMEDFLAVLSEPEWPVAELILHVFSNLMISRLQESKSDLYLKGFAIDWLGILACRIKDGYNRVCGRQGVMTPEWVLELNERLPEKIKDETAPSAIKLAFHSQMEVYEYLSRGPRNTSTLQFSLCSWGFAHSSAWESVKASGNTEAATILRNNVRRFWDLWLNVTPDDTVEWKSEFVFPELDWHDIGMLTELFACRQALYKSYGAILSEIMECVNKDVVSCRTKALRAIRRIATSTPEILDDARIRNSVLQRIHDSSPSVRDAAVEVLARYLALQKQIPRRLYDVVSKRILDTAVTVRKRLVKLLGELYSKCDERDLKIDIAAKVIQRIGDNEVSISDLALKTTQELLFRPFQDVENDGNDFFGSFYDNAPKTRRTKILKLTDIIVGAAGALDQPGYEKSAALAEIVRKTIKGSDDKSRSFFERVFQWIIDCLFERMLIHDEKGETESFNHCLATIYAVTSTCPYLLRETQIATLQPYLTVSQQADLQTVRHVLDIYRDVLPLMTYNDLDFIALMEQVLLQVVRRSPPEMLESAISCLSVIITKVTRHYKYAVQMLGTCFAALTQDKARMEASGSYGRPVNAISKMLLLCGLLCEYFEYDEKREEFTKEMENVGISLEASVPEQVFALLLRFAENEEVETHIQIRTSALQGLGHLFAKYPTLITLEVSTDLMDSILQDGPVILQTCLMKTFQEFLAAEEYRLDKREQAAGASLYYKEIDVDTLLGNTDEFAELGVNGSLMQRYLRKILKCAMDKSRELRYAAFEVVTTIVQQGLAHPVLCMPIIVAAETSPDLILRNKAYYLHRYAHDKYGSILYTHFSDYLTAAFEYQKLHFGNRPKGYGHRGGDSKVDSLFGLMFSIVKQRKKNKMGFLRALVKPFEYDIKDVSTAEIDLSFLRFLADNICTLDLTQSDEVLHILHHMYRTQATLCADLVECLQKKNGSTPSSREEEEEEVDMDYAKMAIAMYLLLRTKMVLMELYDISDSEVQDYEHETSKPRAVSKDPEMDPIIDWEAELLCFARNELDQASATDAVHQFEEVMSKCTCPIDG